MIVTTTAIEAASVVLMAMVVATWAAMMVHVATIWATIVVIVLIITILVVTLIAHLVLVLMPTSIVIIASHVSAARLLVMAAHARSITSIATVHAAYITLSGIGHVQLVLILLYHKHVFLLVLFELL